MTSKIRKTLHERFWEKVEKTADGCSQWIGSLNKDGYGIIWYEGSPRRAHRVAWILAGLELPVWPFVLDHACRTPGCVDIAHLRVMHQYDNTTKYADRSRQFKLTQETALEIRRRYEAGERPTDLAREYGVSNSHICTIGAGKCWKPVTDNLN